MPDITQASVIFGVIVAAILAVITIVRHKKVEVSDIGAFMVTFFSGTNIPPALFLFWYVFSQDPLVASSKLKGYEKYISAAGLVLFLASCIAIWGYYQKAWKVEEAGQPDAQPARR